jgi:hypothetical protein
MVPSSWVTGAEPEIRSPRLDAGTRRFSFSLSNGFQIFATRDVRGEA